MVAVGLALEQRRPAARARALRPPRSAASRTAHRSLPSTAIAPACRTRCARPAMSPPAVTCGHRRELAVEVVLAHEHGRQREHLGEVQALVEVAPGWSRRRRRRRRPRCPSRWPTSRRRWRRRCCRRRCRSSRPGRGSMSIDVHRAGAAAAHAGRAPEHLGQPAPPDRCPWPARGRGRGRCRRRSRPGSSAVQTPTGTASWPAHRCVVPCTSPFRNRRCISCLERRG